MSDPRHDLGLDVLKGTPLVGYFAMVAGGWTIGEWAAFAALIYSLILIAEKAFKLVRWLWRRGKLAPAFVRAPQDE